MSYQDTHTPRHLSEPTLSDLLDSQPGPATPELAGEQDHLARCASCAGRLQELETVKRLLSHLPMVEPPRDFRLGPRALETGASPAAAHRTRIVRLYAWSRVFASSAAAAFVMLVGATLFLDTATRGVSPSAPLPAPANVAVKAARPAAQPASREGSLAATRTTAERTAADSTGAPPYAEAGRAPAAAAPQAPVGQAPADQPAGAPASAGRGPARQPTVGDAQAASTPAAPAGQAAPAAAKPAGLALPTPAQAPPTAPPDTQQAATAGQPRALDPLETEPAAATSLAGDTSESSAESGLPRALRAAAGIAGMLAAAGLVAVLVLRRQLQRARP